MLRRRCDVHDDVHVTSATSGCYTAYICPVFRENLSPIDSALLLVSSYFDCETFPPPPREGREAETFSPAALE